MFYSVAVGGVIDLAACLLLIPRYAVVGAAISNLLAEGTVLVVQLYYAVRCKEKADILAALRNVEYGKILLSIAAALSIANLCRNLPWNDFFILLASGSLFFGVYGIGLYVLKETLFMELWIPIKRKFSHHEE